MIIVHCLECRIHMQRRKIPSLLPENERYCARCWARVKGEIDIADDPNRTEGPGTEGYREWVPRWADTGRETARGERE